MLVHWQFARRLLFKIVGYFVSFGLSPLEPAECFHYALTICNIFEGLAVCSLGFITSHMRQGGFLACCDSANM
jgi:hypothetical protein